MDLASLSGLELLRQLTPLAKTFPNISQLLDMRDYVVEEGEFGVSITTQPNFANPLGNVHGGICATLLDTVMGCSVHTTLEAGTGYSTLELKVNYISTVSTDAVDLIATGKVIHRGRTTATAEGRIVDGNGRLVAHGTTTCLIHPPRG